jgi:hypothetical protein
VCRVIALDDFNKTAKIPSAAIAWVGSAGCGAGVVTADQGVAVSFMVFSVVGAAVSADKRDA